MKWIYLHRLIKQNPVLRNPEKLCKIYQITESDLKKIEVWVCYNCLWRYRDGVWKGYSVYNAYDHFRITSINEILWETEATLTKIKCSISFDGYFAMVFEWERKFGNVDKNEVEN